MGLLGYLKSSKKAEKEKAPQASDTSNNEQPDWREKPHPPFAQDGSENPRASLSSTKSGTPRTSFMEDIRHEVMVNYLFQQQCANLWIGDSTGYTEGILIRKLRGSYLACPPDLIHSQFAAGVMALNLMCAMTVNSRVVKTYLSWVPDGADVPLKNGLHVQVLPTMEDFKKARSAQSAAFILNEGLLVVWDDEAANLIPRAKAIESELMNMIWSAGDELQDDDTSPDQDNNKKVPRVTFEEVDEESGELLPEKRPTHLMNTVLVGVTLFLITVMLGAGFRQIGIATAVDHNYLRVAFVLLTPVQIFFTLFFAQVIVGCVAQCIGPIKQMRENSRFYSAMLPRRLTTRPLPHVTVQCPVYKEGLAGVIAPTVRSVKKAISTYELQGGTANIFINDDGLQLIDAEERRARINFYADNCIGWTARPKHNSDGFIRRGKFKKASNMNFGLMLSNNVETKLAEVQRHELWTQNDEAAEYERCLQEVVQEHGRAWADGNIRIGDYILIIDSDTRVPEDCLLDAVSEMEQSPQVGIMQFSSGVMQVVGDFFENGITFFTNLIYTAIKYTVSNGDVAPFVGHNAILRWSAIQQIGYFDDDGYEKFWSEAHVSEDFEMSLKLQTNGYIIRLAAWAGEGFKEGVSLTVYDELARWEKYAYGCNELLFHPIRTWLWRGPFTPLFRKFLFSNIRMTSKITIISYIGTYYAIGAAWILTLANYFAIGWFNGYLDKYYIDSWKVWFSIVIVFNGLGNFALATMRYRIGERSWFGSFIENIKWTLMLAVFLGGLSLHVSQALLSHMFEINMTWGATSKEATQTNFFIEVPRVLKNFKGSIGFSLFGIVMMVILATADFVPYSWRINDFIAILPMSTVCVSHFLLPIALNSGLMQFTF
ncbi:hypothetical protein BAUCODRAFT_149721 [Baudoinia panamericana UAMH 10762]|uniref:Uncharacterized protein n=1 Tax=Baudoinia panamericana (strain UAMH 10762) TaxID=717646 RepID=M2N6C1_BAUPA|nr:uncharacterized protein BAUCODRAFT_149721 [Baudoinia panamericana UAMH 10762]EMC94584.1 hypothetical protein BAUCODRAFT_149721 [Baudoinia panamericana UAMH 10762]